MIGVLCLTNKMDWVGHISFLMDLSLFRLWQGNILKGQSIIFLVKNLCFGLWSAIYLYDFALWLFYRYISLCALFC